MRCYLSETEDEDALYTASYVELAGRKAVLIRGDITNEHHYKEIIAKAVANFGKIDILVNNAACQMSRKSFRDIFLHRNGNTHLPSISMQYFTLQGC